MSEIEMYKELEQVRIKHLGQCPKPKGHAAESVFMGVVITTFIWVFILMFSSAMVDNNWKTEAIKKGYAFHNSTTGQWQWK